MDQQRERPNPLPPIRSLHELREALRDAGRLRERIGRPFITLTFAQSLDGSIATRDKQPIGLSGPESSRLTHELRALHEGILVGIGTVLSDDPRLTVRLVPGDQPRPFILDTHRRTPLEAQLLRRRDTTPSVVCSESFAAQGQCPLEASGAAVLPCSTGDDGLIDLHAFLKRIGWLGVSSLMVEGGARVISSFLAAGLADLLVITVAPRLINGTAVLGPYMGPEVRLQDTCFEPFGRDVVLWAKPCWDGP